MSADAAVADAATDTDELHPELLDALTADEQGSPDTSPDTGRTTEKSSPDASDAGTKESVDKSEQQASSTTEDEGEGAEEKVTVLSPEELEAQALEALGLSSKDPNSAEVMRDRANGYRKALSEQGQRLKSVEDRLAEKGLKVAVGKDGKAEFIQDGEFRAPVAREVSKKVFDSLSKDERDLAQERPEEFTDLLTDRVLEASAQEYPTALREDVKLDERLYPAIRLDMVTAKGAKGEPKYPDYETLEPYMERMLLDEKTPDAFRAFAESNEENRKMALSAVYGLVHMKVAPLIAANLDAQAQAAEKTKSASEDASLTSQGTRGSSPKKLTTEEDEADEIISAKPLY